MLFCGLHRNAYGTHRYGWRSRVGCQGDVLYCDTSVAIGCKENQRQILQLADAQRASIAAPVRVQQNRW
jgi:hypothetical protein